MTNPAATPGDPPASHPPFELPPLPAVWPVSGGELARIVGVVAGLTVVVDLLCWGVPAGLGVALAWAAAFAALALFRMRTTWDRTAWLLVVLFGASVAQTAHDLGPANTFVCATLLIALAGHTAYAHLAAGWERWAEAMLAVLGAPGRWFWLARVASALPRNAQIDAASTRFERGLKVVIPAFLLGGVLVVLVAGGNAVLGNALERAAQAVVRWLEELTLPNPARVVLWAVVATGGLVLVRPAAAAASRWWRRPSPVPRVPADEGLVVAQVVAALAVVAAVFLAANVVDLVWLWGGGVLPEGVTYSRFVHEGVHRLVAAVALAAAVLTGIGSLYPGVARRGIVRGMSLGCVVLAVLLTAGVAKRLWLYVEQYQWSELRVYVLCFLLLVVAGYGLLAWRIAWGRTLGWLVRGNLAAVFLLFFTIQHVDVAGWVARANVAQWRAEPSRPLDVAYLGELGPAAWPALRAVADDPAFPDLAAEAREHLVLAAASQSIRAQAGWRSWQGLHARHAWALERGPTDSQPPPRSGERQPAVEGGEDRTLRDQHHEPHTQEPGHQMLPHTQERQNHQAGAPPQRSQCAEDTGGRGARDKVVRKGHAHDAQSRDHPADEHILRDRETPMGFRQRRQISFPIRRYRRLRGKHQSDKVQDARTADHTRQDIGIHHRAG